MRKMTRPIICLLIFVAILLVSAEGCRTRVELVYVGMDRVIQELPNGNFEVTPELVILYRKYKKFYEDNKGGK
uniref:Uncharacterized protein n=1 Tax=viral metagenome TaxID=1070528 RepID=A0A6H1ZFD1_9ZZZZ